MTDGIDQIDEQLQDWVSERVDISTVSFEPPGQESSNEGISLYLLELVESPPPRTRKRPPLQLSLRYLVTTWADDPRDAHNLLGTLVLEAMTSDTFELELRSPDEAMWQAFGTPPRPSFFLQVPFRRERPETATERVRQPLVLETTQLQPLTGRVVGPNDVPISKASVEFPSLDARTTTDRKGQFHFAAIPQKSEPERMIVRARGVTTETDVELSESVDDDRLLTIRIEPQG